MNEHEHELHYPHGDHLPAPGTAFEVAPGVKWVRMGLPFALNHINLWLLQDRLDGRDGWTLVDCGIADAPTRASWDTVFEHELGGLPVLRVIVTHLHPDHVGNALWLTERFGCPLWMSATDYHLAKRFSDPRLESGGVITASFARRHGVQDADTLDRIERRGGHYGSMVPGMPEQFCRMVDGDVIDIGGHAWHCIVGHGHAPEHISLHAPSLGVMIAGDMVLPRISTNVGVGEVEPEGNPLRRYLNSIEALRRLPEDTLVLPSHGRPFMGLHRRIDQLVEHHDLRFEDVLVACRAAPCTAAQLLPVLFKRPLDLHQTTFAMGEAIAHLHALWFDGLVRRLRGTDGVWRFAAPASA